MTTDCCGSLQIAAACAAGTHTVLGDHFELAEPPIHHNPDTHLVEIKDVVDTEEHGASDQGLHPIARLHPQLSWETESDAYDIKERE